MKNLISFENFGSASNRVNEAETAQTFDRTKPFSISPTDTYEYKYYAPKKQWYTRNRADNSPKWIDMKKALGSKFQVAYETIEKAIKDGKAVNVSGGEISSPYNSLVKKIDAELKGMGPYFFKKEIWKGATILTGNTLERANGDTIYYADWAITPLGYYDDDKSKWKQSPSEGILTMALDNKGGKENHLENLTKAVGKEGIDMYTKNPEGGDYDLAFIKVNSKTTPLIASIIAGSREFIHDYSLDG